MAHEDKGRPITTWRRPIGEKGETKYVAHEDKDRPITAWKRSIGEKVRSVWHMKTKAGPLLHGGGLQVRRSVWHMKTKAGPLLYGGGLYNR